MTKGDHSIGKNHSQTSKSDLTSISRRFDRGPLANFLEFWRFPGYVVDYQTLLIIPPVTKSRSQSAKESNVLMSTQNTIHENCDHSNHSHNHSHGHEYCHHDDL